MSRKTVAFKQKITQFRSKNGGASTGVLIPRDRVKSDGRMTILERDDSGAITGRRGKGVATGRVGTEPMDNDKADRLLKLAK